MLGVPKDAITGKAEVKTDRQLSAVSRTLLLDGTNSRSAGSSAMGRGDAENDYPDNGLKGSKRVKAGLI